MKQSTCCSAPESQIQMNNMNAIPSKELEKNKKRILKMWATYQQENEDALHSPWIDAGRVCIALGWGLLWMGVGILIGILIRI